MGVDDEKFVILQRCFMQRDSQTCARCHYLTPKAYLTLLKGHQGPEHREQAMKALASLTCGLSGDCLGSRLASYAQKAASCANVNL